MQRQGVVPMAAALVTVTMWGGSFLAIRDAVTQIDPVQLASARFAIAGLAGLIWLLCLAPVRPVTADFPRIALCGILGIALYNVLLGEGEQRVSAGVAAFFVASQTLFTVLVSWWLEGERPTKRFLLGCFISLIGLMLITSRVTLGGSLKGIAFCLAAAILSGAYFVIQRPLVAKVGPISAASATMLAGGIWLSPWAHGAFFRLTIEPALWMPVLYLAVLASIVAYSFWMIAISGLGAAQASQTLFLMAPLAAATEWVLGWERFNAIIAAGGLVVIAGVIIASGRATRPPNVLD